MNEGIEQVFYATVGFILKNRDRKTSMQANTHRASQIAALDRQT